MCTLTCTPALVVDENKLLIPVADLRGAPCAPLPSPLPSAMKLQRLCFYRCLSVHRGVCLSACWDTTPRGPGTTTPSPPGPGIPPEQTPPLEMATAADGTHPTGMHSCLNFMQFFGNFWQNCRLAPPPGGLVLPHTGNAGFAPAFDLVNLDSRDIGYVNTAVMNITVCNSSFENG